MGVTKLESDLYRKASNSTDVLNSNPYFTLGSLDPQKFSKIRTKMLLNFCKWDPQVEDLSTPADFPLVLKSNHWEDLATWSEALSEELFSAEDEIIQNPQLLRKLGLGRKLSAVLSRLSREPASPSVARTLRFDFHFTFAGWKLSEVNSDVPGGFVESSDFTREVAAHYPDYRIAGDPTKEWLNAIAEAARGRTVALLSAPGFMEDQQVVSYLAKNLEKIDCITHIVNPNQILWKNRKAHLKTAWSRDSIGAIVRFFQAEWLPNYGSSNVWKNYFVDGETPLANSGNAAIGESKRLPLLWRDLNNPMAVWKALLPETEDPRSVNWKKDKSWLLKGTYSNTGDSIKIRDFMNDKDWNQLKRSVWLNPFNWVAQKRFSPVPLATPWGLMYPCLGVYTINGKVSGVYGRMSAKKWIDFSAIDIAILVE